MPVLTNSTRSLLKATHVSLPAPSAGASENPALPSSAVLKTNFVRSLKLQAGEVRQLQATQSAGASSPVTSEVWQLLQQFEPQPLATLAPKPSALVTIPSEQLVTAARAILAMRIQRLQSGASAQSSAPSVSLDRTALRRQASAKPPMPVSSAAIAASAVTSAVGAINAFENAVHATPVGMLHLERIEMAPAGIERGELVATIPLSPGETTSVEQKEWSVTSQEFSSIVTDYLENYSEKGVTEKTDLAESSESQTKHSDQLGLNASLSGSYGFVTFSTSANFNTSSEDDETKKASRDHATEVTQKASSRVRQEHKVSIQTSSIVGSSETSTRTLTNPSATDTMRIDYFSLMRKWRVRLLRYGIRMTFDITIPEPGATLRALHARLAELNDQISNTFTFDLDPSAITDTSYLGLGAVYGAVPEPPPPAQWSNTFSTMLQSSTDKGVTQTLEFDVPDGFAITQLNVGGQASANQREVLLVVSPGDVSFHSAATLTDGLDTQPFSLDNANPPSAVADLSAYHGMSGHVVIPFFAAYAYGGSIYAEVSATRTAAAFAAWQQGVWQALYNAARDAYYAQVQIVAQQRDALKAEIEGADTLTLRREEREEVMKGVLRWLLGTQFDFMPQAVRDLFYGQGKSIDVQQFVEKMAEWFITDDTNLSPTDWSVMYSYGEMVKFVMEAIEWENLLYLLYPYFWDIPIVWDYVRRLQHPDPTREEFVRAGTARVVLTIRPGWEDAFLGFLENGEFGQVNHPYMAITDEMQAYANTNYPGIPPANPETSVRPLLTPRQRRAWQDMQSLMAMLEKYYNDNSQTYPTTTQGLAALGKYGSVPSADPWGNPYVYSSPGQFNDYDLSSLGADGTPGGDGDNADVTSWATASLIGEWYEYTPSHGLDIAVTTALADMQ
jgi:Type II secretion system (T2SS), protein G